MANHGSTRLPADHRNDDRHGTRERRSASAFVGLAGTLLATIALMLAPSTASAHDDIAGSDPPNLAVLEEPISSVEIDFGSEISDDVVMFLVYDVGDGTFDDIGGETVRTGTTTAELRFDEIDRQGTYTVRYIAPVPADAHVIQGSVSFTWGVPTGEIPEDPNLLRVTPPGRALLDGPISTATLVFIDDVELQAIRLIHDEGDGERFTDVESRFEQTSGDTVEVTFDPLDREGTYFLAYEADAATTGEEFAGATSFSIGRRSGESSSHGFPVVPFAIVAAAILAIGAAASLAVARRSADDSEHDDAEQDDSEHHDAEHDDTERVADGESDSVPG